MPYEVTVVSREMMGITPQPGKDKYDWFQEIVDQLESEADPVTPPAHPEFELEFSE